MEPGAQVSFSGLPSLEEIRNNVNAAVQYLRARWADFLGLSRRIIDAQHRAAEAAYHARERGDLETYEAARESIRKLGELNQQHGRVVERMSSVAGLVGLSGYRGLGAIQFTAAQVTIIIGIALTVAWFFRALEVEERKLSLVEQGIATPEQLAQLDAGPPPARILGEAANLAKLLLGGAVAYFAWKAANDAGLFSRRARGRARRNPPLEVWDSNPPGGVIGEDVLAVYYLHAEDGHPYVHEFAGEVELIAEDDGTVTLEHRRGRDLWRDFEISH